MSYSIAIAYKPSKFQKFVQRLTFGKPPKFKAPYVGALEWMAIIAGICMYYVTINPPYHDPFQITWRLLGGISASLSYTIGGNQPKRKICTSWKILKVIFKYWIYYTVGFNLIMTFLARKQTFETGYIIFLICLIVGILLNYFTPSDYDDGNDETA